MVGDSVEYDWANVMKYFHAAKAERFSQPGFRQLDLNWLLIYDNWELPAVRQPKAARFFQSRLDTGPAGVPFDRLAELRDGAVAVFPRARRVTSNSGPLGRRLTQRSTGRRPAWPFLASASSAPVTAIVRMLTARPRLTYAKK